MQGGLAAVGNDGVAKWEAELLIVLLEKGGGIDKKHSVEGKFQK